jgi:anaerobic selenocysteine-containing dehydrogenase
MHLMEWVGKTPGLQRRMPFVLAKTLGRVWNSASLAASWGMLMSAPKTFRKNAARAGFQTGPDQGDRIFQALLDTPQGLWVGKAEIADNWSAIRTPSGKIEVFIPELAEQANNLNAVSEAEGLKMPPDFPFILNAGRHMDTNMNTLMRNPEWNNGKRACTIAISPADAGSLGLRDGQPVRVATEAGSAVGELQVSTQVRSGMVLIPHGFGLIYGHSVYGINVNQLTKNTHRDPLGTPIHRFVPCRIESI